MGSLLAVALTLAAIAGSATTEAAWAANCTNAQLIPDVADLRVVQGAPLNLSGTDKLVRGKSAIVRAYLRNPTNCTLITSGRSAQTIEPTSATLSVTINGAPAGQPLANRAGLSGRLTTTEQVYSTADPYFVVPASYLAPGGETGPGTSFSVQFSLQLRYNRTGATGQTAITGATSRTATVDQRTKALRVLVVPMGDKSSGTTQWSSAAYTTLQNVMTNTGRAFPVPEGVTESLASQQLANVGGIRYVVSPDLLDVKALGLYRSNSATLSKFCANSSTWETSQVSSGTYAGKTLKTELQERLRNYNLQNTPPADVVLGVVDGAIAWRSVDGITGGCDDGRAATPDPLKKTPGDVAWVRVDTTGSYQTPAQMELFHTIGIVDPTLRPSFHSLAVEADGLPASVPNKGYNLLLEKIIALGSGAGLLGLNDHSIMNYDTSTIPYRADNTLVEPRDWMDGLCNFGGIESATATPFAACTISTGIGTSLGVGAGTAVIPMFHIVGELTPDGTDVKVVDANVASGDVEIGVGDGSSPLHLFLCTGPCASAGSVRNIPLAFRGNLPIDEDHFDPSEVTTAPPGRTFGALVTLANFTCAELRLNGATKFSSCANDPAPDIVSTAVSAPGTVLRSFTPFFPSPPITLSLSRAASESAPRTTPAAERAAPTREGTTQTLPRLHRTPASVASVLQRERRLSLPTGQFSGLRSLAVAAIAQQGSVFTVNSTDDHAANACDAECTLRDAITEANGAAGSTIAFDIPGVLGQVHTIRPTSILPPLTGPTILDATTQPGYAAGAPVVEVNGELATTGTVQGIRVYGGDSIVRGLVVNNFNNIALDVQSPRNRIEANFIGTDPTGTVGRQNRVAVFLTGDDNVVGGASAAERNVVSGNFDGIRIFSGNRDQIRGNYVGTTAQGNAALGNCTGIDVNAGSNHAIVGNVVSATGCAATAAQIEIRDTASAITIQGNKLGTDASGASVLGGSFGVEIGRLYNDLTRPGPSNVMIGGTAPGAGNIIAGNSVNVWIVGSGTSGNAVVGNLIGTNLAGQSLGGGLGVQIQGATQTTVGGTDPGAGNTIAFHSNMGVWVSDGGTQNRIVGNSIHSNGKLGIDLVSPSDTPPGVTANDAGDADSGANNLQNFPVIQTATLSGSSTSVTGSLDGDVPGGSYRIEFFRNTACDGSGNGEGDIRLGATTLTADGQGDVAFNQSFTGVSAGEFVTATATDPNGNTSEFSACKQVAGAPPPPPPSSGELCCNGRAIAFDGTYLYLTVATGSNNTKIIKAATTDGEIVNSVETGVILGALGRDAATGKFYGGNYGNGDVYDVNVATGGRTTLFNFSGGTENCDEPVNPDVNPILRKQIDGLELVAPDRLALSGDVCDRVYLNTLTGAAVSDFATDNNSGITTDGAGGLWLARLKTAAAPGGTVLTRVSPSGAQIGDEIVLSSYQAEDIAYDATTFAPACAVWMNQATTGSPKVQAVAVPCGSGGGEVTTVKTANTDFVTLYAVCGNQASVTDPETEKFSLGTYVPDASGQTIVPVVDDRYCANATVVVEASNGWTTTGLNDPQGGAPATASPQAPVVSISAPLDGATFRIGDTIRFEGNATDAEDGTNLTYSWTDNGGPIGEGAGKTSFDRSVASGTALGNHVITFTATDSRGPPSGSTSVQITIRIAPRVCSSTFGCR